MRRVAGYHDVRMDGMTDVLMRVRKASVLDVGCNRGMVGLEFAANGAEVIHGCDNYVEGINTAREIFADQRGIQSKFEVVDLTLGSLALAEAFGDAKYSVVLMLATYHKLKRTMPPELLRGLVEDLGYRTKRYFCWRGTSEKIDENTAEMKSIGEILRHLGLVQVHSSRLSDELDLCAVWRRNS